MADDRTAASAEPRKHMRKGVVAVLLCLVLAGGLSLLLPENAARTLDYSVQITTKVGKDEIGEGSGTVIRHIWVQKKKRTVRSIILTCAHVLQQADSASITTADGREIPATIVPGSLDPVKDLALLEVDTALPMAPIFFGGAKRPEPVVIVGNEFGDGLIMVDGRAGPPVSVFGNGVPQRPKDFEITASNYEGSSGGGVFVRRYGRYGLVGVTQGVPQRPALRSLWPVMVAITTVQYAIRAETIREYLAEHPV